MQVINNQISEDKIKDDENTLGYLDLEELEATLHLLYTGSNKLKYYFFLKGQLLFSGNDYKPSPLYPGIDSIESFVGLLVFLVLKPGDTDVEYFANYTPDQLAWAQSNECEQLSCRVSDFDNNNDELDEVKYHAEAYNYFRNSFIC